MDQKFNVIDVFNITGRGCVAAGEIEEGVFHLGDPIKVLRNGVVVAKTSIAGIEMINYSNKNIKRKDTAGLLLKGFTKQDVLAGDILVADDELCKD